MSTTPAGVSPIDLWKQTAASMPDVPDNVYDAQRQKFFESTLMPWAMQQGFNTNQVRQQFWQMSERPGKAAMPRLELAAKSAVQEAAAPVLGVGALANRIMGEPETPEGPRANMKKLEDWVQASRDEAARQGISTTLPEMVGRAVGSIPYFAAAMEGMGGSIAGNIAAMATASATMDAAKAQEGQRLIEGFKGGVTGAAMGAGFEALGALPGLFRTPAAQAVSKTIAKVATPEEQELANAATIVDPKLPDKVMAKTAQDAQAAEAAGVPKSPPEVTASKQAMATFTVNGKTFQMPADQFLAQRQAGVSLDKLSGSATEIQAVLKTLDKQNSKVGVYNTDIRPRGDTELRSPPVTSDFEQESAPVRSEGVEKASPSAAPSAFSAWSKDAMERTLQERILDTENSPSAVRAAELRLQSLSRDAYDDVMNYKFSRAEAPPQITPESLQPSTPVSRDDEQFIPLWKSVSAKGTVNVNSVVNKVGLNLTEATELIERAKQAGLLQPIAPIVKSGGAEVIDNFRVLPKRPGVAAIPQYDRLQGEVPDFAQQMGAAPQKNIDDLLAKLRQRLREKYPEADAAFMPETAAPAPTLAASELEQQLRASLEKLKFPGSYPFGVRPQPEDVTAPWMNPDMRDMKLFSSVPKQDFVETVRELDPNFSSEDAARFYDWNLSLKNVPTGDRGTYINVPMSKESRKTGALGLTFGGAPGWKPLVEFNPEGTTRGVLYHEGQHALLEGTGLHLAMEDLFGDEFSSQIFKGGLDPAAHAWYVKNIPQAVPEETFVWLSQAYRSADTRQLQAFADADGGRETLDQWFSGKVQDLIGKNSVLEDSLYKRKLDRRLRDLVNRSGGSLEDMSAEPAAVGSEVDFHDGHFLVRDESDSTLPFETREDLADHLRDNYSTPMVAPELVPLDGLPAGLDNPGAAARPSGRRAPIGTNIPPPELIPGRDKPVGISAFSFYFRPFYNWLDDVSEKFKWPELKTRMDAVQNAQTQMNAALRPYDDVLKDTLTKIPADRQSVLFKIVEAAPEAKEATAQTLGLTDAERTALTTFNEKFVTPLENELGASLELFIRKYQGPAKMNLDEVSSQTIQNRAATSDLKFLSDGWRTGELDPRDQNLLQVASAYARLGMRKKFMEEPLREAGKLVNASDSGSYLAGNLQPLLARHLNYLRGIPDNGAHSLYELTSVATDLINGAITQANKVLPAKWQLDTFDTPRDLMNKWIGYSYAGGLMLRPMVPLRDVMQFFITTFPMLGAKYSARGIAKFMSNGGEEITSIPREYGALLGDRQLMRYETGSDVKTGKWIDKWMNILQWSHNANRVPAFWGHAERVQDALRIMQDLGSRDAFAKEAGMNYLTDATRNKFLDELAVLPKDKYEDYSYRVAAKLVDASQWNFSTGATPGIYKYALGKVFGQYGSWPLNYIEWARNMVYKSSLDPQERVATLTRLFAAHSAILGAGQASGVDTAGWVFTQPGAYGGGPIFTSLINIPGSLDFDTERGADARRKVIEPIWPLGIPGGLAAERIRKAIASDDPDTWKIILGFHPMKPAEYGHGLHILFPEDQADIRR